MSSENQHGCSVGYHKISISADANMTGQGSYLLTGVELVRFDDSVPGGVTGISHRKQDETIFSSEEEAEAAVRELLARNEIRARTEKNFLAGLANHLRPQPVGAKQIGGWTIVSRDAIVAAREKEAQVKAEKERAKITLADEKVREAQKAADKIRAELDATEPVMNPAPSSIDSTEWIKHDSLARVQQRKTKEGLRYRGRKAGKISPSFATLEAVVEWLDGGTDEPAPPKERFAGVVDPEAIGIAP